MEINMEAFDIRSECFYFINPGELHSVRAASTEVVQEYAVVFHPELLCSPFYDTVQSQLIQPLKDETEKKANSYIADRYSDKKYVLRETVKRHT